MSPRNAWNHWCNACKKWVHEELIAEHLQKRHGKSAEALQRAAAAMRPQPKAAKSTSKAQEKLASAMEYETKLQERKELFKEIDRVNFPSGTRLTPNFANHISRGGGFMSKRSKF